MILQHLEILQQYQLYNNIAKTVKQN